MPTLQPLRVALVGLGDIAAKYLPVLTARPDVIPVLVTRNPDRLAALAAAHRVPHAYPTLADSLDQAQRLVELAEALGVSLMVGFNRRFAPPYLQLAGWPQRDVVVLHKHRHALPGQDRSVVFDDFVHVLDTLRLLATPDPSSVHVSARVVGGLVHRLLVHLEQDGVVGIGVMDRDSGSTEESLEVLAPGRRARVVELAEVTEHVDGQVRVRRRDEWTPVPVQRGFAGLIEHFLTAVRTGQRLDARDALATHALCEQVLAQIER